MYKLGFLGDLADKESTCNARYLGLIPVLGRSPGEGNYYPLQYSGLENSMDFIPWIAKSQTRLSHLHSLHSHVEIKKKNVFLTQNSIF